MQNGRKSNEHPEDASIAAIARRLDEWFQRHRRPLPFREHYHPYECWIAEVIFQQTRIDQGLPYYRRFLERYPTVQALAEADEEDVLKLWQGLGYYRRALHLVAAARQIVEEYGGTIPRDRDRLLAIRGIGPYIAAALRAIAFNEPDVVIDGNVRRVISRWFGIAEPVDTAAGTRAVRHFAEQFLRHLPPRRFNEAVMEFGALQCTPVPQCITCPMQPHCIAFRQGRPTAYPVRKPRRKPRPTPLHLFHFTDGRRLWLVPQKGRGIWRGLYLFPHYSSPNDAPLSDARRVGHTVHILSHRRLEVTLWHRHMPSHQLEKLPIPHGVLTDHRQIGAFPMPRLMEKLIEQLQAARLI